MVLKEGNFTIGVAPKDAVVTGAIALRAMGLRVVVR
ncbi:hypothetical protein BHY_1412 (plasmid) [Borrelia nietonii YOR]|uniref:Uncharacterized protein n=2 Tax=Borrelia TaxID=138 RepID=W5SCJ2_9SPIR|nr:hypothetical protein BHY_1412 [Borrelia nietonii YOR]AHH14813.1 hypothetical protein BHW_0900073 [Borrelia hermsii MTW]